MNVILVGNANSGKTSLFNQLTGLNQKTANYPGTTIEKSEGRFTFRNQKISLTDLPGAFSVFPRSIDEKVVTRHLSSIIDTIGCIVYVIDATNLERSLFFFSQISDLNKPVVGALNFTNELKVSGKKIDIKMLENRLGCKIIEINAKTGKNVALLKEAIIETKTPPKKLVFETIKDKLGFPKAFLSSKKQFSFSDWFLLYINDSPEINFQKETIAANEVIHRYKKINELTKDCIQDLNPAKKRIRDFIDRVVLNPVWGLPFFLLTLFVLFQVVFYAGTFGDYIDQVFVFFSQATSSLFPNETINDIISNGIIPSLAAVFVFIPQIATLFFLMSLLEQSGYMSRVIFLADTFLSRFGLNGKSSIPYISAAACAVPAIMACRTIENRRERFITMLSLPLMTCSARLPVFAILIAFIFPEKRYFNFIDSHGLIMFGLYIVGFLASIGFSMLLNLFFKKNNSQTSLIEPMPKYRLPSLYSTFFLVWSRIKFFLIDAGKIIMVMSVIMWGLLSFGPSGYLNDQPDQPIEASFLGMGGKFIEPAIEPLGYNWEIGIALIASFAAREVFISTIATIYNFDEGAEKETLKQNLMKRKNKKTGKKVFNFASAISLIIFYTFALQCLSTIAVLKREMGSWKYPITLFFIYGFFAYIFSLMAYQVLTLGDSLSTI